MARERRSKSRRSCIRIDLEYHKTLVMVEVQSINAFMTYLIIDQTPLFQERVNAHDGAYITRKISSASGESKVLRWPQSVRVDHEVAVVFVY